jgi:hypothetical protein
MRAVIREALGLYDKGAQNREGFLLFFLSFPSLFCGQSPVGDGGRGVPRCGVGLERAHVCSSGTPATVPTLELCLDELLAI